MAVLVLRGEIRINPETCLCIGTRDGDKVIAVKGP